MRFVDYELRDRKYSIARKEFTRISKTCARLIHEIRPLHNLTIFVTQEKRIDFSEVTGVRALFFQQLISGGNPAGSGKSVKLPHR